MLNNILLGCLLLLPAASLLASTDGKAHFESDSAIYNHRSGIGTYLGHVSFTQGGISIDGEKAETISNQQGKLTKTTTTGNNTKQAVLIQSSKHDKPELIARANKIIYMPLKHRVILIGDASITKGSESIRAQTLNYDLLTKRLESLDKQTKQVKIQLYPNESESITHDI